MTRDNRSGGHLSTNDVTVTSTDNNNNAMATRHTWDIADNVFPVVSYISDDSEVLETVCLFLLLISWRDVSEMPNILSIVYSSTTSHDKAY